MAGPANLGAGRGPTARLGQSRARGVAGTEAPPPGPGAAASQTPSRLPPARPPATAPTLGAMDPALAAQLSEAVAEKVLQYRRDQSGWKMCREGVSEERGRKGSLAPGAGVSEDPRLLLFLLLSALQYPGAGWGGGRFHRGLLP